jgi:hypothetical protein
MSFKKAIMSTAAAALIVTAANATMNVEGTGQYLVFPKYYALSSAGGWQTDLRVVNTNETAAVIAKVVIRAQEDSVELLDFPIYLSPGDIWVGKLYQETDGKIYFYSEDDSMVNIDGTQVSATAPAKQALFKTTQGGDGTHDATRGYVEIFSAKAIDAKDVNSSWSRFTPLAKKEIFAANAGTLANTFWYLPNGDEIYGQMTIKSSGEGSEKSMTLLASAFSLTGISMLQDLDNAELRGSDTKPSTVWTTTDTNVADQILADTLKDEVYVTHYTPDAGETQIHFTQPMKKVYVDNNLTAGVTDVNHWYHDTNATNKVGMGEYTDWCFYYETMVRDLTEDTYFKVSQDPNYSGGPLGDTPTREKVCHEVQSKDVLENNTEGYSEGWTLYRLYGDDSISNSDFANETVEATQPTPVIPTAMTAVKENGRFITNIYYPAYK